MMDVNDRIRKAVKGGIKMKTIADKAGVSYYRVSSVINPLKYKGESSFDKYETKRINEALETIAKSLAL
jgi:DNA-binding LacI/PurR family transcriptional regulator